LTYTQTKPAVAWDEAAYMAANPDIAASINEKGGLYGFKSGQDHYERVGKTEGRTGGVSAGYGEYIPDQWVATQTYSPEQQRLYDLSTQAQTAYGEAGLAQLGKLRDQMSTPFALQGAPAYQDVASRSGQVASSFDRGGNIATSYDTGGPIARGYDAGGDIVRSYQLGGDVASGYDTGGPIQRQVGPNDFSADRTAVEDALYARLNPSLDMQRTSLEARLRNQGLAPGSEAWTNAMRTQTMAENDARLGVTAAGLQEQQGLFGMDLSRGNFANAAQAQQYGQNASLAAFGNAAQQQRTNQNAGLAAFANSAQAQANDQNYRAASFGNQAQQQAYGQNQGLAQFANQAQAQQYGQNQGLAQFGNQAALQQQNMDSGAGTYAQNQRQQMLAEQLAIRNQPLNETSALLTGSQVQQPQFTNTPGVQVANTDTMSPANTAYQGQLAGYQGQVATNNANTGAAAGTLAAAASVAAIAI
jgi:hypothetical protein